MKKLLTAALLALATLISPPAKASDISTITYIYLEDVGTSSFMFIFMANGAVLEVDVNQALFNHFLAVATTAYDRHWTMQYDTNGSGIFGYPKLWWFETIPN